MSGFAQNSSQYTFNDATYLLKERLELFDQNKEPGFSLLVGTNEDILLQYSTGLINLNDHKPIETTTPFYIASIGKSFTSLAILKLYENGSLKLENTLDMYFPNFPEFAKDITLYHLLTHTSGLPNYERINTNEIITNSTIIDFVSKLDSLSFKQSHDYSYSNTAYILLSEIIHQVSGLTYSEFLSENFFLPLGMNNTVVIDSPNINLPHKSIGYSKENDWQVNDYQNTFTTGSGGMYSTPSDLYLWYKSINENRFISQRTKELMFNSPVTLSGKKSYMLMGWFEETFGRRTPEVQGLQVFGAIGILNGFRANMHMFPNHDFVFILLSNTGDFPIGSSEIAEIYFQKSE